jgi:hypothetical protein
MQRHQYQLDGASCWQTTPSCATACGPRAEQKRHARLLHVGASIAVNVNRDEEMEPDDAATGLLEGLHEQRRPGNARSGCMITSFDHGPLFSI